MKERALSVLCLAGWAQKPDSLNIIFDNWFRNFKITNLNFAAFDNIASFFEKAAIYDNPQVLIGWSLGGQLAIRLIANKIFSPKLLVLLAPPFQFIRSRKVVAAISHRDFERFKSDFIQAGETTAQKFLTLMTTNDQNAQQLSSGIKVDESNHRQLIFWLEELGRFSCLELDFSCFPRTVLIHGSNDLIVHPKQSGYFAKEIPNLRLEIFGNCSHAPHLSNPEKIQEILKEEISALNLNINQ